MSAARTMTNKATVERLHHALNSGDEAFIAATIDEIFDPDVHLGTPLPVRASGAEALKQVWTILLRAYPDLHVAVQDLVGEGDRVAVRNRVTGTHRGEYLGIAPTGRSVAYDEMFLLRFAGGRIVETSGVVDLLSQLRQLGALPPGPPAGASRPG
jgi:predicted ester cyclase